MERYFLEHHVQRDLDPDELVERSDDENSASDNNGEDETTVRTHSVHDPAGPWKATAVSSDWGHAQRRGGMPDRDYQSQHTGPKGVRRDYYAYKKHKQIERERKEQERTAALLRIAKGATRAAAASNDEDLEDDDAMLVDDAFLRAYNAARVKEMQQTAHNVSSSPRNLEFISPSEFVGMTDNASDDEVLVVHLYDPSNYSCDLLNQHLQRLAKLLPAVKFAAMVAAEADESIKMRDLPVLMIYRGVQLQETIVNVARELEGEFTFDSIQRLLQNHFDL